jgi:hypothetical protein
MADKNQVLGAILAAVLVPTRTEAEARAALHAELDSAVRSLRSRLPPLNEAELAILKKYRPELFDWLRRM